MAALFRRWASGAVEPDGYRLIERFRLLGTTPVWTYAAADALVEKRVWMAPGANTTYVRWLLGPFALAHFNVYGDAARALSFLAPLADHLGDHGLGSIAEIFDGAPPFRPNGCIAQAWSVAETLRAWQTLAAARGASSPSGRVS